MTYENELLHLLHAVMVMVTIIKKDLTLHCGSYGYFSNILDHILYK